MVPDESGTPKSKKNKHARPFKQAIPLFYTQLYSHPQRANYPGGTGGLRPPGTCRNERRPDGVIGNVEYQKPLSRINQYKSNFSKNATSHQTLRLGWDRLGDFVFYIRHFQLCARATARVTSILIHTNLSAPSLVPHSS